MKVAVVIYGALRQLDIAIKSWKFRHVLDCDFYFSTWNKSIQISKALKIIDIKDVNEDSILQFIPNAKITIHNEMDFFEERPYYWYNCGSKMPFHIKHCLKMIRESGIKYDYMIVTRSDFYFDLPIPYEYHLRRSNINTICSFGSYGKSEIGNDWISDLIFYGEFDVMNYLFRTLPNCMENIHEDMAKHFLSLNIKIEAQFSPVGSVLRPTARELKESELTQENLGRQHEEWGPMLSYVPLINLDDFKRL